MKKIIAIVFMAISLQAFSQLIGEENVIGKEVYQGTFVVNGDKDKFYPVIFKNAYPYRVNHLKVFRAYGDPGPSEYGTHKASLTLELETNYGSWGGQQVEWHINRLAQQYRETFGDAYYVMHKIGFVVFLRGGGLQYKYESEYPAQLQVALNKEIIYNHSNNNYDVYAPEAITEINKKNIVSHKRLIGVYNNDGKIGIGTAEPDVKLTVQGHVNIGGVTNTHLKVRHVDGKATTSADIDNLYLNYNIAKNVWVGGTTKRSDLIIANAESRVGIGTTSPDAALMVNTKNSLISRFQNGTPSNLVRGVRVNSRNSSGTNKYLDVVVDAEHDKAGFGLGTSSGNLPIGKTNLDLAQIVIDRSNGGKVGIGTANIPSDFKLAVAGKMISEEVTVKLQSNWPDYVFENRYNLPTLKEVENHIQEKGHLQNIPSAKEVAKNGIQLGEMNKKLLEKIEELTLYTIQQEKRIEKLETKNTELKNQDKKIEALEKKLNALLSKK